MHAGDEALDHQPRAHVEVREPRDHGGIEQVAGPRGARRPARGRAGRRSRSGGARRRASRQSFHAGPDHQVGVRRAAAGRRSRRRPPSARSRRRGAAAPSRPCRSSAGRSRAGAGPPRRRRPGQLAQLHLDVHRLVHAVARRARTTARAARRVSGCAKSCSSRHSPSGSTRRSKVGWKRSSTSRAARLEVLAAAAQRAQLVLGREVVEEGAERDDDQRVAARQGEVAHVGLDDARLEPERGGLAPQHLEHAGVQVEAVGVHARLQQRAGSTRPVPQADLEHRAARAARQLDVERDVVASTSRRRRRRARARCSPRTEDVVELSVPSLMRSSCRSRRSTPGSRARR